MGLSFGHILVVALLVVLLFGRGKISALMGDMAKGIKAFKRGMAEEPAEDVKKVERDGAEPIDVTPTSQKKDV